MVFMPACLHQSSPMFNAIQNFNPVAKSFCRAFVPVLPLHSRHFSPNCPPAKPTSSVFYSVLSPDANDKMKLKLAISIMAGAVMADGIRPPPSAAADAEADDSGTLLPSDTGTTETTNRKSTEKKSYADWVASTDTPGSSTIGKCPTPSSSLSHRERCAGIGTKQGPQRAKQMARNMKHISIQPSGRAPHAYAHAYVYAWNHHFLDVHVMHPSLVILKFFSFFFSRPLALLLPADSFFI